MIKRIVSLCTFVCDADLHSFDYFSLMFRPTDAVNGIAMQHVVCMA